MGTVGFIAGRYELTGEVVGVLFNSLAAVMADSLIMAGAAVFKEPPMFAAGLAIAALAPIGAAVGLPAGYLVMSLLGGGVIFGIGLAVTWGRHRRLNRQAKAA
jgi:hypothetical protein